jgi:hypothetical protein
MLKRSFCAGQNCEFFVMDWIDSQKEVNVAVFKIGFRKN